MLFLEDRDRSWGSGPVPGRVAWTYIISGNTGSILIPGSDGSFVVPWVQVGGASSISPSQLLGWL